MPSRNRGPNSAPLWGLDDATATRPRSEPPSRPPVPPQVPEPLTAPAAEQHNGDLVLLLSVEDAGKALGVSRSTVYELIGSGDLEVVHIDRSARVPVESVRAYVDRLRSTARDREGWRSRKTS